MRFHCLGHCFGNARYKNPAELRSVDSRGRLSCPHITVAPSPSAHTITKNEAIECFESIWRPSVNCKFRSLLVGSEFAGRCAVDQPDQLALGGAHQLRRILLARRIAFENGTNCRSLIGAADQKHYDASGIQD